MNERFVPVCLQLLLLLYAHHPQPIPLDATGSGRRLPTHSKFGARIVNKVGGWFRWVVSTTFRAHFRHFYFTGREENTFKLFLADNFLRILKRLVKFATFRKWSTVIICTYCLSRRVRPCVVMICCTLLCMRWTTSSSSRTVCTTCILQYRAI